MAGGAIGLVVAKSLNAAALVGTILAALAVLVLSFIQYRAAAFGPPGPSAATALYIWTCGIFTPLGLLASLAGVKLTAGDTGQS